MPALSVTDGEDAMLAWRMVLDNDGGCRGWEKRSKGSAQKSLDRTGVLIRNKFTSRN